MAKNNVQTVFEGSDIVKEFRDRRSHNNQARHKAVVGLLANEQVHNILDIGCGGGGYLDLVTRGISEYHGVDFADSMVKSAQTKAKEADIQNETVLLQADSENLPYQEDHFDALLAIGLIEYLDELNSFLQEIESVLEPGGIAIIQSWKPSPYIEAPAYISKYISNSAHDPRKHGMAADMKHRKYSKEELDERMEDEGFELLDYTYANFWLLPKPLDAGLKVTGINSTISNAISELSPKRFSMLSPNYIGKYKNENSR